MNPFRFLPTIAATAALLAFAAPAQAEDDAHWLDIEMGKSVVLETPKNATAIAITDPTVADVVPLASASRLQIQGKKVGSTDLVVQLGAGVPPIIYEVTVHRDLSEVVRRIDDIVEGTPPRTFPLENRIVVEGEVDDLDTLERIAQVARIYDPQFVNLMRVRGDHQVQLEVVFAEVDRSGLRELGLNWTWTDATNYGFALQSSASNPASFIGPVPLGPTALINGGLTNATSAGTFNAYGVMLPIGLGVILSILDDYKLSKTLSQPTLVSLSGQQADFMAGGEVPVPAPAGLAGVTVQFKPYGVLLTFVPTVLANNVIDLRVDLEVSQPDYATGTRLTGVEIPGFLTRKGSSHLRLQSGMTFAMAGMLTDNMTYTRAIVPLLGQIPLVGSLFRYTRHEREELELVIFVTPRLVRPMAPGEVPAHPGANENNLPSDFELFLLGLDHRTGSRIGDGEPQINNAQPAGMVGLDR
jgi:pilus assembly protein CpaC